MTTAEFTLLAAGLFFMNGLLTGVWKYVSIMKTDKARAPYYVDVSHRASLMYAFAAILIREFIPYSPVGETLTFWLVAGQLLFFASAIRSEEHTSELQSRPHLVCRLLLEKKKIIVFLIFS